MALDSQNPTGAPAPERTLSIEPTGGLASLRPWIWPVTLAAIALAVAFAYHDYPSASLFQTDDYVWRLWAELEPNPWRAFCDDLAAGQAFRPLRYLSWYFLELLIPHVPEITPLAVLTGFICYGCSAGFLASQVSRDRWVGLTAGALALLCPLLGPSTLTWYSVLEDMMPPTLMLVACIFLTQGVRTARTRWLFASLVPAALAGLWKEIAFVMPALACVIVATGQPGDPLRLPDEQSPATPARSRIPQLTPIRLSFWCLPFFGIVTALCVWRYWVIGSGGFIGHHALLSANAGARLEQLIRLAGLAGALPVGLFYVPAVAQSFPISMKPTADAWSVTQQLASLLILSVGWLVWLWLSPRRKTLMTAGLWYVIAWIPALALTVVQPSYLYLPAFAVCLLVALLLREIARKPVIYAAISMAVACIMSVGVARRLHAALPVAAAVRHETDSLLEMVRQESAHEVTGTRIILVGSRVLRPDIIAELDAVRRNDRCKFDLYNFESAPVDLIAPAIPFESQLMGPLVISTEGLRDGRIKMAGHELYFVDLRGSKQQLAEPRLNNRFWAPSPTGWRDITDLIRRGDAW